MVKYTDEQLKGLTKENLELIIKNSQKESTQPEVVEEVNDASKSTNDIIVDLKNREKALLTKIAQAREWAKKNDLMLSQWLSEVEKIRNILNPNQPSLEEKPEVKKSFFKKLFS